MSKKNLARKVIALVAIVTMFAAMTITASAASYESTTMYVNDETVKVTTYVTGLTSGDQVTYYAANAEKDVYVNQYEADAAAMKETYVADKADVAGLTIKMAKVSKEFDGYELLTGSNESVVVYTVNGEVVETYNNNALPTGDEIIALGVAYAANDELPVVTAKVGDATVSVPAFVTVDGLSIVNPFDITFADGKYTVAWGEEAITGLDFVGIDFTVADGGALAGEVAFTYVGVQCAKDYTIDDVTGDMFAVLYDVALTADVVEVGIKVGDEYLAASGVLGGETAKFAIAVVQPELASFKYTPYAKLADGSYVEGASKFANFSVAE